MTRLSGVIFVCVATGAAAAAMAAAGCSSSSSNPAAPVSEAAAEASVEADAEGEAAVTSVALQWKVVSGAPGDGGVMDNGPGDGSTSDDGGPASGDGAASDGATTDDAASDAGISDASVEDAAPTVDAEAAVAEGGGDVDAGDASGGAVDLSNLPPLAGVQVCIYQNSSAPCVTTQADGTFTMSGLPVRSPVVLAFTKSGFNSYLLPIETASTDMDGRGSPIVMDPPGSTPGGITDDATKGIVEAFAVAAGAGDAGGSFVAVPGTQVALSPMTGSGPYFFGPDNQYDNLGTSFVDTTALYYNVDPGTYTLTYTNSAFDCEPISFPFGDFGIPVTTPAHSVKIVVGANYVTGIVGVLCTPNPVIVAVDGG